jgi:hypothetical protein
MTTTITDLDDFKALDPFFRIIEKGLEGIADGERTASPTSCAPASSSSPAAMRMPTASIVSAPIPPSGVWAPIPHFVVAADHLVLGERADAARSGGHELRHDCFSHDPSGG